MLYDERGRWEKGPGQTGPMSRVERVERTESCGESRSGESLRTRGTWTRTQRSEWNTERSDVIF